MYKNQNKSKNFIIDSLEAVAELGQDAVKTTGRETNKNSDILSSQFGNPTLKERKYGNNNFTDIDFNKLQTKYDSQDSPQLQTLRAQINENSEDNGTSSNQAETNFFQKYKREEEEYLLKKKQEEEEKEQQEKLEEERKKQELVEKNKQKDETPKGKVRKSILGDGGHKKSTSELPPEYKPGAGKQ